MISNTLTTNALTRTIISARAISQIFLLPAIHKKEQKQEDYLNISLNINKR